MGDLWWESLKKLKLSIYKLGLTILRLIPATFHGLQLECVSFHLPQPVLKISNTHLCRGIRRRWYLVCVFLASGGAESAAAPKQTYVPLRLSMSASVPRKERVEKSQHVRFANPKKQPTEQLRSCEQAITCYSV